MQADIRYNGGPVSGPALHRIRDRLVAVLTETFDLGESAEQFRPRLVGCSDPGITIDVEAHQLSAGEIENPARKIYGAIREEASGVDVGVYVVCAEGQFVA